MRLLAVDPDAQGAGLGEALMRASLEVALEWGADALVLDTGCAQSCARRRCTSASGFEREPARDVIASAAGVEALVYRFPLQQRADVRVRLMRADETRRRRLRSPRRRTPWTSS